MRIPHRTHRIDNIKRLRQILQILAGHGFGFLVDRLNAEQRPLGRTITAFRPLRRINVFDVPEPTRLRLLIEELGPTFIKFGQVLSTRPDLIPLEYCQELAKLQDNVPPCAACDVTAMIEAVLKAPVAELFREFSVRPVAAASLAQVHHAVLPGGEPVVVKLQRPGIEAVVRTDMQILEFIVRKMEQYFPEVRGYNFSGMVRQLRESIARELNYFTEAASCRRIGAMFERDATVFIPKVYPAYTSRTVLTMERVEGIKITDAAALDKAKIDRHRIAVNGARAYLRQVFDFGFFHADPHPGNLLVLPDGRIAFLDFGMTGRLRAGTRDMIAKALTGVVTRDMAPIVEAARGLGTVSAAADFDKLTLDIEDFIDRYYVTSLREIQLGERLADLVKIVADNHIRPAPELLLLSRTFVTIEGVGRQLDPDFDMTALAQPFVARLLRERRSPKRIAREAAGFIGSLYDFALAVPRDVREILAEVKQGKLRIEFEHQGLEGLIHELDKFGNRLSFALIIAALIVGSSIIIHADKGVKVLGHSALGVLGFAMAGIMGLWLAWAIFRSGKL